MAPREDKRKINEEPCERSGGTAEETHVQKSRKKYPHLPVFFLLGATVGQSYVASGLQAVLELYFVRFLFVCMEKSKRTMLGTSCANVYIAIYQLCAISAGILADKLIGNYCTQLISVLLTMSGMFLLSFSTWQYTQSEPSCCHEAMNHTTASLVSNMVLHTGGANCSELHKEAVWTLNLQISPTIMTALALLGLILYAVGYGHINTLQSVFVADQFTEEESIEKRRSFSWYYLCCNLGALVGESGLPVLRQSLGFVVAWITLLGSTTISTLFFVAGSYVYVKKRSTPKCLNLCTCCKRTSQPLSDSKDEETSSLLLEPAERSLAHSLLSLAEQLLPFLGFFGPLVMFWAVFYQQNTTWVVQGTHMNCYLGKLHIPPDLMPSVNDFLVVSIIPLLEYIVYPHLEQSWRIQIRPLHKVVVGMVSAALSFLMAGLLQLYLASYQHDDCHGYVSIAWQIPQIILISVAEVTVCVTGLEFAYSRAPPKYRNVVTAMWYLSQALGTLLNAGVAQIHQLDPLQEFLVYMALLFLVTFIFILINRRFR